MINGKTSIVLYYGAIILLAMVVTSATLLSIYDRGIPQIIETIVIALLSYLAGTQVKPPSGGIGDDDDG